jgi:(2Fe-2S) ferredoxin
MCTEQKSPYECLVLVCTNDRQRSRKSCADGGSPALREALKDAVAKRGWKSRVRVSQSGCLGLCEHGPNVLLQPENVWFSGVSSESLSQILNRIEKSLMESETGPLP